MVEPSESLQGVFDKAIDTAKKLKQRLRVVFKWCRAQGYCYGDDPVELAEMALPRVKNK